jgi:predicted dehydrogenase
VIGVGIVGTGYWGPKHVRVFRALSDVESVMAADLDEARLQAIAAAHEGLRTTTDYRELLRSSEVDAIVVAVPVSSHARLAREALLAGKHVLVEKPLASSSAECQALIDLAAERGLVLMVGHTFLYNPAVLMLRELVMAGELGEVYYAHAQRLNLGQFQRDINVLWDLAPHDLSILMYVIGLDPWAVAARGRAHVCPGIEDVAYMDVVFPNGVSAAVHVSWLYPNKVRRLTLVGSKKMAVFDDVEPQDKLRLYDKGVVVSPDCDRRQPLQLDYRQGEVYTPPLPEDEPLRLECEHFVACILHGTPPRSSGEQGLKVVRTLESADESLARGGVLVPLAMPVGAGMPSWNGALSHHGR